MRKADAMVDSELVLQWRQGESDAFEALVRRYRKEAYRFALHLTGNPGTAEDIAQEGFVNAYRALADFRGDSSFRSWLFRILVNLNRDRIRSQKRYQARLEAFQKEVHRRPVPLQESGDEAQERSEYVREKIDALPDRQREVLLLHLYQQMEYREIAATLGIRYESVKMNLSLARKKLRQELKSFL